MNHRPIQTQEVEKFQQTLQQAIGSLAAARAMYSSMVLTPDQIQSPGTSNDKGYMNLTNAGPALDMALNQCMGTIFTVAKDDAEEMQKEKEAKMKIVKASGGMIPN